MAQTSKDMRRLLDALEAQGFSVQPTKNGHYTVYKGKEWITTFSGTPSCSRAAKNSLSPLRRAGFVWRSR